MCVLAAAHFAQARGASMEHHEPLAASATQNTHSGVILDGVCVRRVCGAVVAYAMRAPPQCAGGAGERGGMSPCWRSMMRAIDAMHLQARISTRNKSWQLEGVNKE